MKTNEEIVLDIIEECIELDAMFTYYDIYQEACERGCSLDSTKIGSIVYKHRYPLYYKKSEVIIEGLHLTVIHPGDFFPENYDITEIKNALGKSLHDIIKMNVKPNIEFEKASIEEKRDHVEQLFDIQDIPPMRPVFDKRGRFSVSASDVRNAGFLVGDHVHVILGLGKVRLDGNPITSAHNVLGTLTVDKYFNLRVKDTTLLTALNGPMKELGGKHRFQRVTGVNVNVKNTKKVIILYPEGDS